MLFLLPSYAVPPTSLKVSLFSSYRTMHRYKRPHPALKFTLQLTAVRTLVYEYEP